MNALSTAIKFFQDCGLFIYPSILIMALGLAIAIERFVFLSKARNQNRKVWSQVLPMLQKGQFKDVQGITANSDAAIGKIVNNGLVRMHSPGRREDLDAAMEEGMMEIVPRLEKRTHYIATFANVITLVLACRNEWISRNGIATISANAVLFIAIEIDAESISAFSAGLTCATAVKPLIRPMMVPSRPTSVITFAKVAM